MSPRIRSLSSLMAIAILGSAIHFAVSCSYVPKLHISGFLIDFDPEAGYDAKYFSRKHEGEGFPDSIGIRKINKVGWFELKPDSSATRYLVECDSVQFRKKLGDSTVVLSTLRPWTNMHVPILIDDSGTKYFVRYMGRGVAYIDNLQIGSKRKEAG